VTPATVLVADDDAGIRTVIGQALERAGYEVRVTSNAATLWRWVSDGQGDVVITDVLMPDENGLDLVPRIRKIRPELRIVVMSAQSTLLTAVKATERGAFEYLPKPFDLNELVGVVRRALEAPKPRASIEQHTEDPDEQKLPLIGRSPAMQEIYRTVARLMGTDLTVLITGESGTGKELVARALHDYGKRRAGPFVAINMAAIPRDLIESELFGHEKGAFTGAIKQKPGKFELANNGTIFLDEIGAIGLDVQASLLRVLQEKEFERIGGHRTLKADVRVIAATNKNLEEAVEEGTFRGDLYYRLNVFPIYMPPLRERKTDMLLLADHFLEKYARENGKDIRRFSTPAIDMLMNYHWPGNVRELENCIERSVLLCEEGVIHSYHLPPTLQTGVESDTLPALSLEEAVSNLEREMIIDALKNTRGNISQAAELLQTTVRKFSYKAKRYGVAYMYFR
jgi:two-component system nitrogen regulation response regulator GlnG